MQFGSLIEAQSTVYDLCRRNVLPGGISISCVLCPRGVLLADSMDAADALSDFFVLFIVVINAVNVSFCEARRIVMSAPSLKVRDGSWVTTAVRSLSTPAGSKVRGTVVGLLVSVSMLSSFLMSILLPLLEAVVGAVVATL